MAAQTHKKGKITKRTYLDEVYLANMRAERMASGMQVDGDSDDTDSVASSASLGPKKKKIGISPLNRRHSLRLAIKNEQDINRDGVGRIPLLKKQSTRVLRGRLMSQQTVEMATPPVPLERMETSTRWSNWRNKRPVLSTQDTIGTKKRIVQRMDTTPGPGSRRKPTGPMENNAYFGPGPSPLIGKVDTNSGSRKRKPNLIWSDGVEGVDGPVPSTYDRQQTKRKLGMREAAESKPKQPAMLKKMSTTWGLRQMFGETALDDVPQEAAQEAEAGVLSIAEYSSGLRTGLKRKATVLQSPPVLESAMKKSPLFRRGTTVKKQVKIVTPDVDTACSSLKKEITLGVSNGTDTHHRRKRRKGAIQRQKSQLGDDLIYFPPEEQWAVTLPSQVVWSVPLIGSLGTDINGYAVHIDPKRCLIGDEEGRIIELDENVVPTRVYELPSGIKCIVQDGDFTYVGCDNGGLYDLTHGGPRLVSHCRGFGQVYSVDVFQGLMAASDQHGNVALINHRGAMWKRKSAGEFGWMVLIDDSGVYHGHSKGVTKYSLLDGLPVWQMITEDSVLHGVQKPDTLYIAAGSKVIKLDKITGAILRTYSKGKSSTQTLHSNAVAGGMVFAGGKKLVCYDEESGDIVYVLSHDFNPASMKYYCGRLFCVGKGGMNVVDLTQQTILNAQEGNNLKTVTVHPDPKTPKYTPQITVNSVSSAQAEKHGIIIECIKPTARKGSILARTKSKKFNKNMDIQIPADLCKEGQKFVVQDLKASDSGGFYRIFGEVKAIK